MVAVFMCCQTVQGDLSLVTVGTESVVRDSETGLVWYADLHFFTDKTYAEQITVIDGLNTTSYFGVTDWHLASLTEMEELWAYASPEIAEAFNKTYQTRYWRFWYGRYEAIPFRPNTPEPAHHTAIIKELHYRSPSKWENPGLQLFNSEDALADPMIGAWVVGTALPSNTPPVAVCQDVPLELDENGQATLTASQVDGGSSDPDDDPITLSIDRTAFTCADIGGKTVTLTVTDDKGASASCQATVTVLDVTPPAVELNLLTGTLWPVNHKLVKVADISATDICDAGPELFVEVSSNEPINGPGDGNTEPDWVWDADTGELYLRAERSGGGDGRVYSITVTATDAWGNAATVTAQVIVPHDKGKGGKG